LFGFFGSVSAQAEEPWIEVRSPHFCVLTNGNKSDAREVAYEFEQMRYLFSTQFPSFRLDSGAPLTIFAARDERTAKQLIPVLKKMKTGSNMAGMFLHGWEKQYVMLRLDQTGLNSREIVYHEYTHSILHLNSHWLPTWLDEGMAEFYGYTRFEQNKIEIGAPTVRVGSLQDTTIPIADLMSSEKVHEFYRDADRMEMFYAESWALVHYLIFGPGMEGGAKLDQFFALVQQDTDQKKAFQQVFGSIEAIDKALGPYMRSLAFHAAVLHTAPEIDKKNFIVTKLTMAQTEAELAGFHLWNHDLVDAAPLIEQALKDDPKLGLAHEEKGFLLFAQGQDAAADEFSQAYALDGTLYLSLFAKTMLSTMASSHAPADEAALHDALLKVTALNPQFAPAYVQMARLAVRQGDLQRAFGLSRRAEELEPSRAGYHLLTGQILLREGKDAEAAQFAEYVAKHWPPPDHNEAVELWNAVPAAQRPKGETMTEEFPADSQVAEGIVKSTTCDAGAKQPWTLVLGDRGKELTFHRQHMLGGGFSDTLWWGEDHFNICRHLVGLR